MGLLDPSWCRWMYSAFISWPHTMASAAYSVVGTGREPCLESLLCDSALHLGPDVVEAPGGVLLDIRLDKNGASPFLALVMGPVGFRVDSAHSTPGNTHNCEAATGGSPAVQLCRDLLCLAPSVPYRRSF